MCLSIPVKILSLTDGRGEVDCEGTTFDVDLSMIDDPAVGEYVLVHAGYAIQKYEEAEALETLELLKGLSRGSSEAI